MNRALAITILLVAGTAAADKKIQAMTPGFDREAKTCATQISGLEKVKAGSTTLAPSLAPDDKAALDKDLETLVAGLATVKGYCAEVTGLVDFLNENAAAPYRSVERELDTRDNKVRKLRKESKKTIEALQPITRRWIGKIAQAQTQLRPDPTPRTTPGKFPSGRTVELPPLTGQWKLAGEKQNDSAEYADKTWSATAFVRTFTAATCEQQQRTLPPQAKPVTGDPLGVAEGLDVAWRVAARGPKAYTETLCVRGATGGWLATLDVKPGWTDAAAPLRTLLVRMIVAQRGPK